MDSEIEQQCFNQVLEGSSYDEVATEMDLTSNEVLLAVEKIAARRTNPDDFETVEEAIEFLRLERMQKRMWRGATRGGVEQSQQVLQIMERKDTMKKSPDSQGLTKAVRDMLNINNVSMIEPEEQEDE